MYTRVFYFILISLLVRCKTSHDMFTWERENIDIIELEINNLKIPLEKALVDDFTKDFSKNEPVHSDNKFVHLLDLYIHTKDEKVFHFKSNGSDVFYNDTVILVSKENLIFKYWKIYEENIPHIKAPSPRMN